MGVPEKVKLRRATGTSHRLQWDEFLESFVGDQEFINRVNAQNLR